MASPVGRAQRAGYSFYRFAVSPVLGGRRARHNDEVELIVSALGFLARAEAP